MFAKCLQNVFKKMTLFHFFGSGRKFSIPERIVIVF